MAVKQQEVTSSCHMLDALAPQRVHALRGAGVHGVPQAQLARMPAAPGEQLAAPGHQRSVLPPHRGLPSHTHPQGQAGLSAATTHHRQSPLPPHEFQAPALYLVHERIWKHPTLDPMIDNDSHQCAEGRLCKQHTSQMSRCAESLTRAGTAVVTPLHTEEVLCAWLALLWGSQLPQT